MFQITPAKLPGCFLINFRKIDDKRGAFVKTYHGELFKQLNIKLDLKEEYFTFSESNVFRGLHFQEPPTALDKIVFCVKGKVTDYLVDLRKGSPTFGQWQSFELNDTEPCAVYAPIGIAHGFHVKEAPAILQYKVSEVYDPLTDKGISYKSFSFAKDLKDVVISDRDETFTSFQNYNSPFSF